MLKKKKKKKKEKKKSEHTKDFRYSANVYRQLFSPIIVTSRGGKGARRTGI